MEKSEGVRLTCKRCGSWVYRGKAKGYYTSCPSCKSSIRISERYRKMKNAGNLGKNEA